MAKRRAIELARQFRREPTPAEAALWRIIRNRRLAGYKFRRQHPLGGIIADCYCAEARLLVELDGLIHLRPDVAEYDRLRDEEVANRNLRVLRVPNEELFSKTDIVLRRIPTLVESDGHAGEE
jgi:very-short-patch-repair endonuclease